MRHHRVNIEKLARRLKQAAGTKAPAEIARAAKIDPSRVTRFLNGDFKRVTPVLRRLCSSLKVPVEEFLLDSPALGLSAEVLGPLRRIVGRDPRRILAASRLLRSLEALTVGGQRPGNGVRRYSDAQ
jgi:transcriptional regulator with XRE-family HTH domain